MNMHCNGTEQYDFIGWPFFFLRALTSIRHSQRNFIFLSPLNYRSSQPHSAGVLLDRREEIVSPNVSGVNFNREIMLGRL